MDLFLYGTLEQRHGFAEPVQLRTALQTFTRMLRFRSGGIADDAPGDLVL
jgi:hypothetical protein